MANIDYNGAKADIEKIFAQSIEKRKIVFWYDAPKNFENEIKNDTFINYKLLICDKNEFFIKKTIEHDDLDSNFLIYIPAEKPADLENWLLDILLYSEEYYADAVALVMRRLKLENSDLRHIVEKHQKFFDNAQRTKKLDSYVVVDDNMTKDQFKLAMMAVLTKADNASIDAILTELVFDDSNNSKYNELIKFKFEDDLWEYVCEKYNYDGELKISLLIKKFIFTTFLQQRNDSSNSDSYSSLPSFYNQFIIKGNGAIDAKGFIDRIKQNSRYEMLQSSLSLDMKIEQLISVRDISSLQSADVFECFDIYIINTIAESLRSGSLDYEAFERIIYNRVNSMWYLKYENQYQMLLSSIKFFKKLEKPLDNDLSAVQYIDKYVNEYYKIDREYRNICTCYKKIENPSDTFGELIANIENYYQSKYLDELGIRYTKALSNQKDWNFLGVNSTADFYQFIQKSQAKKMFVIISDALRYEIGMDVYEKIKKDPIITGGIDIDFAVSSLPSETRFGMASLLPNKIISYNNKNFNVDSMPTNSTENRNAVLKNKNNSYAAITYDEINDMTRNELRTYMADKSLVYIYHDVIDNAGEHNEKRVFDLVPNAVEEIVSLIRKIFNNLQISNFCVTADHGFLYRRNEMHESTKYSGIVQLHPLELHKRYIITDDMTLSVPYTLEFNLKESSNKYKVITPNGYDIFKTQGGGIQYIHGGSSLQETIVPIIRISESFSSKYKNDKQRLVGVRLKTISRKITTRSFTLEFEQYEKIEDKVLPITCETYIVDENNNLVSNVYKFVANSSSDDSTTRLSKVRFTLNNQQYDRNKPYFMILKNADNNLEYIEKVQFTIDIIGFKLF